MQNRLRPYNKSLLVNVFMSSEYKDICKEYFVSRNIKAEWHILRKSQCISNCVYNKKHNILKLLLNTPMLLWTNCFF